MLYIEVKNIYSFDHTLHYSLDSFITTIAKSHYFKSENKCSYTSIACAFFHNKVPISKRISSEKLFFRLPVLNIPTNMDKLHNFFSLAQRLLNIMCKNLIFLIFLSLLKLRCDWFNEYKLGLEKNENQIFIPQIISHTVYITTIVSICKMEMWLYIIYNFLAI